MSERSEWEWFGSPGHFCCGRDCRFHMTTLVGDWIVSTVGEYEPDSSVREVIAQLRNVELEGQGDVRRANYHEQIGRMGLDEVNALVSSKVRVAPETIGYNRTFETMVFRFDGSRCTAEGCDCGMPLPDDWTERDARGYNAAGEATRGHMEMCERWCDIHAEEKQGTDPS